MSPNIKEENIRRGLFEIRGSILEFEIGKHKRKGKFSILGSPRVWFLYQQKKIYAIGFIFSSSLLLFIFIIFSFFLNLDVVNMFSG